jgi:hypothetical protein
MSTVGNSTTGASSTSPASGCNMLLSYLLVVFFLFLYRLNVNTANPYADIMLLIFTYNMICFMIFKIKIYSKISKNLTCFVLLLDLRDFVFSFALPDLSFIPSGGHGTLGFRQGAAPMQVNFLLHFLRSGFASRPPGSSRILIHGHLFLLVRFQVPLQVFPACLFGLCCERPTRFHAQRFLRSQLLWPSFLRCLIRIVFFSAVVIGFDFLQQKHDGDRLRVPSVNGFDLLAMISNLTMCGLLKALCFISHFS